jgi:thiol-disulfide isomerase/thioredoxin
MSRFLMLCWSLMLVDPFLVTKPPRFTPARIEQPVKKLPPRLIVYTAPEWCAPCRQLDRELKKLEDMVIGGTTPWKGRVGTTESHLIQIVDASDEDSEGHRKAAAARVTRFPCIVRTGWDGKENWRYTGTLTAVQVSQYQAGKLDPVGRDQLHAHRCPSCQYEWKHSAADITDEVQAHTCQVCGTMQYAILR